MRAAIAEKSEVMLDILPLHLSVESARSLAETRFAGSTHPTGVYAFGDPYAAVLLGALKRLNKQIPQEVALVGTGNLPIGEFVWPSLTTLCFDTFSIGKRAIEMFHTLHQGEALSEELARPLVPQLIQREST